MSGVFLHCFGIWIHVNVIGTRKLSKTREYIVVFVQDLFLIKPRWITAGVYLHEILLIEVNEL